MKHVLDINLGARLAAYTKNALLEQAPQDSKVYGRKNTEWVEINLPEAPSEDGDYVLKCKIVDSVASYSWEAAE